MLGVLTLLIVSVLVCHVCIIIASVYINVCMCVFMYSVFILMFVYVYLCIPFVSHADKKKGYENVVSAQKRIPKCPLPKSVPKH